MIRKFQRPLIMATVLSVVSSVMVDVPTALSATFRYKTSVTDTLFTEEPTSVNGVLYDGTFENFIFDPFAMRFRGFFGLFSLEEGILGGSISVRAVQTSPIDRTFIGEEGIAKIEYLAFPENVATVPGALIIPPNLGKFDFKFIPAPVARQPTVVTVDWTVTQVPEPNTVLALSFLGFSLFLTKKNHRTS